MSALHVSPCLLLFTAFLVVLVTVSYHPSFVTLLGSSVFLLQRCHDTMVIRESTMLNMVVNTMVALRYSTCPNHADV